MSLLRNVLLAILALSLLTFIALFGQLPALRKTPIGLLQRTLCLHLPNGLQHLDRQVSGGRLTAKTTTLAHYLFYEQNPVVLILFLVLLTGSIILFLWNAFDRLPTRLLLPVPALLAVPYAFTYLTVRHKAHFITPDIHQARLHDYPYDHILFRPGVTCSTCNLIKPARSKHCSLCGYCVAKCDHHCPWVNNCLGRGNYQYFLGLLLSLGVLQIYGAYLSWHILSHCFFSHPSNSASFLSLEYWQRFGDAAVDAVNEGGLSIAGVGLLAASTAALPLALFGYHLYLIWAGMTTNESQKWADWRDDMTDGFVFQANRNVLRTHNRLQRDSNGNFSDDSRNVNPALDAGDEVEEPDIPWPKHSDVTFVRTNDGESPIGQDLIWTRVWSLKEVENIYDLGVWKNVEYVLKGQ